MTLNCLTFLNSLSKKLTEASCIFLTTAFILAFQTGLSQCTTPTGLSLLQITDSEAIFTFNSEGNNFLVEYGPVNFTLGYNNASNPNSTLVTVNSTIVHLLELNPATAYDIYVRQICNNSSYSTNSIKLTLKTTACSPVDLATTAFIEDFSDADEAEKCSIIQNLEDHSWWHITTLNQGYIWFKVMLESAGQGPGNAWFITKGMKMVHGTTYIISYRYRNTDSYEEKMRVAIGKLPDHNTMTTILADHNNIISGEMTTGNILFTPSESGIYHLGFQGYSTYHNAMYDLHLDDIKVEINPNAGIQQFKAGFTIYPNPFDNVISISNSQSVLINKVEITDLNGRTVKSITLNSVSDAEINLSELSDGMYFMNINSDKGTGTYKIIKK